MKIYSVIRKMLYAIGFFSIFSACTAKQSNEEVFINNLNAAYQKLETEKDSIKIDTITNFDWDKLFIFAPYTPIEIIDKTLGKPSPSELENTRIFERDDINVFVFLKNDLVINVFTLPREILDLSLPKSGESLDHQMAIFTKSNNPKILTLTHHD